jgi:hypothetical protein
MLDELSIAGIALHPDSSAICINEKTVSFSNQVDEPCAVAADTVIIATGAELNTGLHGELIAAKIESYMVGDCAGVGYIVGAVRNAADVSAKI